MRAERVVQQDGWAKAGRLSQGARGAARSPSAARPIPA